MIDKLTVEIGQAVSIFDRAEREAAILALVLSERTRAKEEQRERTQALVEGFDPLKHETTIGLWKAICFAIRKGS